jgi:nucleotide-binding universal stress UspA family protein
MLHLQTILHPTDLSDQAEHVFDMACTLAQDYHARVVVLHVLERVAAYGEVGVVVETEADRAAVLRQLHALRGPAEVLVDHRLEEGVPASVIVGVAEEMHCDLIVMGTHGRRGLSRLFLGSVAEQVVRHAQCPVLTVKGVPAVVAPSESAHAVAGI